MENKKRLNDLLEKLEKCSSSAWHLRKEARKASSKEEVLVYEERLEETKKEIEDTKNEIFELFEEASK